ncbi:MAG: hypothetical protein Q7S87_09960 [Agitococcus sp.]|nr:hypothetical protein [Agitococcus sp.]
MTMTTLMEMECFHLTIDPYDVHRITPNPDEVLSPLANTPVRALTSSGVLIWLMDGSVVLGDWCSVRKNFLARQRGTGICAADVRAWAALPSLCSLTTG